MEWSFISKASVGKSTRLPILAREYLQGEEEGEEEGGREGEDIGILRWRKSVSAEMEKVEHDSVCVHSNLMVYSFVLTRYLVWAL